PLPSPPHSTAPYRCSSHPMRERACPPIPPRAASRHQPVPSSSSLLVFAHTPPPVHGQSLMVQTLVDGLPSVAPQIVLHHVNPRLSRNTSDIGRWRPTKLVPLLAACL